jgi:hypothetical protein
MSVTGKGGLDGKSPRRSEPLDAALVSGAFTIGVFSFRPLLYSKFEKRRLSEFSRKRKRSSCRTRKIWRSRRDCSIKSLKMTNGVEPGWNCFSTPQKMRRLEQKDCQRLLRSGLSSII